ncbi:MAG: GNAT family N-acetyltransferase [Nitrososphaerales archaeon]|nr:GNAT family N-acetyltransferase [Nitrososphaerales archaeon]
MSIIDKLHVRDGVASDLEQISELCKSIWNGRDFLPTVWNNWISNEIGSFIVVESENQILGVYHHYILDSDSWLETLRVHEQYRRQGIAQFMIKDYLERSKKLNAVNSRLVTSIKNTASRNLFEKHGFSEVLRSQYCSIELETIKTNSMHVEFSILKDSKQIYSLLKESMTDNKLIPLWWRWWQQSDSALHELSNNSFIIVPKSQPSFVLVQPSANYGYGNDYQILFHDVSSDVLKECMSFIKNNISSSLNKKIFCIPEINSTQIKSLENIGFNKSTSLVILERRLSPT